MEGARAESGVGERGQDVGWPEILRGQGVG